MSGKVWIIGCNGMLGTAFRTHLSNNGVAYVGTDMECDITDLDALTRYADGKEIAWIVNCAAYTAVDKAEEEIGKVRALNVDGPRNIAKTAAEIGAGLIHTSTDYVYDGEKKCPYVEEDKPNPMSVYGRTKLDGEKAVFDAYDESIVLRTAWLYGHDGGNFVYTMLRLFKERDEVRVVDDQRGSPTYAADLAAVIAGVIMSEKRVPGVYHAVNAGETSWYGFACVIYDGAATRDLIRKSVDLKPIATTEYPTKAKRPANSVLDTSKLKRVYGLSLPPWEQALDSFLDREAER